MSSLHDENYNFCYVGDLLFVGDGTNNISNGAYNKSLVDAILPSTFNGQQIYGTYKHAFHRLPSLKTIFIPKTYKILYNDFCPESINVDSIVFEENSQVESIGDYFAQGTAITSIILPSSLKTLSSECPFRWCNNLKQIIFLGRNKFEEGRETFKNVTSDLVIFVGRNYRWKTFGGRKVTGVLYRYGQHICTCRNRRENKASLIFVIIIHR